MTTIFHRVSSGIAMENFLRAKDVCRALGISRATLGRWVRAGNFPKPVKLGANSVAWSAEEVDAWRKARMAEREWSELGYFVLEGQPARDGRPTDAPSEFLVCHAEPNQSDRVTLVGVFRDEASATRAIEDAVSASARLRRAPPRPSFSASPE